MNSRRASSVAKSKGQVAAPPSRRSKFQENLLAWYRAHQRALPFRGTRDPYRIWLSEIMLQQTRVAAVLPYYRKFLKRFPDVKSLARAREPEVLKFWAGLGYYSRARNLHAAAKQVVREHGGRFPGTRAAALALPGVGEYTAAAVLSIAYRQPLAALDGNVARVLARVNALRGDVRQPATWKRLGRMAQELLPPASNGAAAKAAATKNAGSPGGSNRRDAAASAGEWNQAMMELGATVCTPKRPGCDVCPVAASCLAQRRGLTAEIPAKRRKHPAQPLTLAAAVMLDSRRRTLLVKQDGPAGGEVFSNMWQFPAVEVRRNARQELCEFLAMRNGQRDGEDLPQREPRGAEGAGVFGELIELESKKHNVTYRAITLLPFLARVAPLPENHGVRVVALDSVARLPVSSATRKIAAAARDFLQQANMQRRGAAWPLRS